MKIVLINPPFLFHHNRPVGPSQCLGLRSLSAVLKKQGHSVSIIDALSDGLTNVRPYANGFIFGLGLECITARIPTDTELIGIGVPFSQLAPIAHDLIATLRNCRPNARIVMGGVYPSTQPKLALTSQADFIVIGEGETAICDIAAGKDPASIKGVYTKNDLGRSGEFKQAEIVSRLDDLPFTDYELPGVERYFMSTRYFGRDNTASIVTSRGCPYACEFCSIHPVYGNRWRSRSSKNVLDEIGLLNKRFGIRRIEFEDDNLTLDRGRAAEIFEGINRMNEEGAAITWCTPNGIRIDTLDAELIRLMKISGCESITMALEHGDPEILRVMNKNMDLEKAFHVITQCIKHEIPSITLFILVGYPGETRKSFGKSKRYIRRILSLGRNINIQPNIVQPYPGTKLLERCRSFGYIKDDDIDNFLVRRDVISTAETVSITTPEFDVREVYRRQYLLFAMQGPLWKRILKFLIPRRLMYLLCELRNRKRDA